MTKGIRIGLLAAFFLVLLRIAIGWHFLYEGLTKLQSHRNPTDAVRPFTAEPFLASATGPFRQYYVRFVPDPYGLDKLDKEKLLASWRQMIDRYAKRYHFSPEQMGQAEAKLEELRARLDDFFADEAVQHEIEDYRAMVARILEHERRQLEEGRWVEWGATELDQLRQAAREKAAPLLKWVNDWTDQLQRHLDSLVTEEQRAAAQQKPWWAFWLVEWPLPDDPLAKINLAVMYGLTVIGACMLVGLFSRLSSLAAAAFLLSVYLAHPPWPGLPIISPDGGSYMIVNKELIEALAALVLAVTPTGRWIGLDALVRGLITRRLQYRVLGKVDDAVVRPKPQPVRRPA